MGDVTDFYQIPYITDEDLLQDTPRVDKQQAERIDYLFSINTGPDGKSAYDVYVESVVPPDVPMSEEDWLESLNGDVGASAYDKLLPAHQPVELSNTQFGHLLAHTSHAPLNYYPIGTVIEWAGARVDNGWLWCDGKGYDYTVNGNKDLSALYSVIGHKYGGSGNMFAVPDKRTEIDKCEHIIYAGGDTSAVTSNWQRPFDPADSASASMPVGTIIPFALPWNSTGANNDYSNLTAAAPYYLPCTGGVYPSDCAPALAAAIGHTYVDGKPGTGDDGDLVSGAALMNKHYGRGYEPAGIYKRNGANFDLVTADGFCTPDFRGRSPIGTSTVGDHFLIYCGGVKIDDHRPLATGNRDGSTPRVHTVTTESMIRDQLADPNLPDEDREVLEAILAGDPRQEY